MALARSSRPGVDGTCVQLSPMFPIGDGGVDNVCELVLRFLENGQRCAIMEPGVSPASCCKIRQTAKRFHTKRGVRSAEPNVFRVDFRVKTAPTP